MAPRLPVWLGTAAFLILALTNSAFATHTAFIEQFGTEEDDSAFDISTDSSAIYILGHTQGLLDDEAEFGPADFIRKYDSENNLLWTKQFGSGLFQEISVGDGVIYLAGTVFNNTRDDEDIIITKLDSDGNIVWTKQFEKGTWDRMAGIAVDDDDLYIAGYFLNQDAQPFNYDSFIKKLDSDGNQLWVRKLATNSDEHTYSISAAGGAVYLMGDTGGTLTDQPSAGDYDMFVAKFDSNGNSLWINQFGTNMPDSGVDTFADSSGIYIAGQTYGSFTGEVDFPDLHSFASFLDSDGNIQWTTEYGSSSSRISSSIGKDESGVYILGESFIPPNFERVQFIDKLSMDGESVWFLPLSHIGGDISGGPLLANSRIHLVGTASDAVLNQTNIGGNDAFLVEIGTDDELPDRDDFPPQVTVIAAVEEGEEPLKDGSVLTSGPITFSFAAEDNVGVTEVSCQLESSHATDTRTDCTSPLTFADLEADEYAFTVDAQDAAGNHGLVNFHFEVLEQDFSISEDTTISFLVVNRNDTLEISANKTLTIEESTLSRNYGTVENNGIIHLLTVSAMMNHGGATILNNPGSAINLQSEGLVQNEGIIENHGLLSIGDSILRNMEGGLLNNLADGELSLDQDGNLYNAGTLNNEALLEISESYITNVETGTVNNLGRLLIRSIGGINNNGLINNEGTIENSEFPESNSFDGTFINNKGVIRNSGSIFNRGTIDSLGGTLIDDGFISRSLVINACDIDNVCDPTFATHLPRAEITISPNPFTLSGSLVVQDDGELDSDDSYFKLDHHLQGTIVVGNISISSYLISETTVPANFSLIYDDVAVTFHPLYITDQRVDLLHIDSQKSIAEIARPVPVQVPDLTEEQFVKYKDSAYTGLVAGIQDFAIQPIDGVVDMNIVDVKQNIGGAFGFNVTVSYAGSDLGGRDPSLLRLFQFDGFEFRDITLDDPGGHDFEAKTVTGVTDSANLLALAFEEPSLSEGFQTVPTSFLFVDNSLPVAKIATTANIESPETLVSSVVFATKASEMATSSELFNSFSIPRYPSIGKQVAADAIYIVPAFLIPQEEAKNNFLLTPIFTVVHPGTTVVLKQSSFVESELARVNEIQMTFGKESHGVGFSFGITRTPPPGTPPLPVDVPVLFLNIGFVGDTDFSDPASFESSPTIDVLVNKTLPGFDQLPDGCIDFELLLFNEASEEWETIQKLRDPVRDTPSECAFELSPGHFSKFGMGGVVGGTITTESESPERRGGGGGHRSPTTATRPVITETNNAETSFDVGTETLTVKFESLEPDNDGNVKVASYDVGQRKAMFDEVQIQEGKDIGIVRVKGTEYSTAGAIHEIDAADVKYEGMIDIVLSYDEENVLRTGSESSVRLLHYDSQLNGWEDQTVSVDMEANTVTAKLDSLSPVVVAIAKDGTFGNTYFEYNPLSRVVVSETDDRLIEAIPDSVPIPVTIKNLQRSDQSFVYIVQIVDSAGIAQFIGIEAGILLGGENRIVSTSWTPDKEGNYTAGMFVLSEMDNPLILSSPASREFAIMSGME